MHLYQEQFLENHDFPRVTKPSKVLIIASTGRSGSHMLGHALHENKNFGFPLEYVNPGNIAEWKRRLGKDDFKEVLSEIQQRRTSQNGVFGIKIHYSHIKMFGGFDQLKEMFPDAFYVLLTRKDVLKQAISLSIAGQTGVWISGQEPVTDNPQYNFKDIDKCLSETICENASWRYILAANKCNHIEMSFDFVRNNLASSIEQIAKFMDIEVALDSIPKEQITKKQSNNINNEWEKRFLSDYNESELFDCRKPNVLDKIKGKIGRFIQA